MSQYDDPSLQSYMADVLKDKYGSSYLEKKYGLDAVQRWRSDQNVSLMLYERRKQMAKEDVLLTEQWNNLKSKAFDIIARALNGDLGDDNQLSTAKWVLSGERSYAENRAKVLGEREADKAKSNREPLKVIRINGND